MTIRRFTADDGCEGATFSDGWTVAREPGTPISDMTVTTDALCEYGMQVTWLDAEPAELTEAQRLAEQIIRDQVDLAKDLDYSSLGELLDNLTEGDLMPRDEADALQEAVDKAISDAVITVTVSWPEPAATPEQDGGQAEGGR